MEKLPGRGGGRPSGRWQPVLVRPRRSAGGAVPLRAGRQRPAVRCHRHAARAWRSRLANAAAAGDVRDGLHCSGALRRSHCRCLAQGPGHAVGQCRQIRRCVLHADGTASPARLRSGGCRRGGLFARQVRNPERAGRGGQAGPGQRHDGRLDHCGHPVGGGNRRQAG
ncbi:hypothetical protein GALL_379590 [mine drainage metagenome]|uniref:Uncharacterized protein n=1 Tax=mine drainage metagenome TaxID=410659 RepID=A0A1J5QAR5_9ZZZZ